MGNTKKRYPTSDLVLSHEDMVISIDLTVSPLKIV